MCLYCVFVLKGYENKNIYRNNVFTISHLREVYLQSKNIKIRFKQSLVLELLSKASVSVHRRPRYTKRGDNIQNKSRNLTETVAFRIKQ